MIRMSAFLIIEVKSLHCANGQQWTENTELPAHNCKKPNCCIEPNLTNAAHVANVCFDDFVSESSGGPAFLSTYTDTCHFRTHVN